ncbi:MAG: hypothetical protein D6732_25785 [Methanobacteriota archaeon]|nr:MAG: hypothetical protein D6732_25785 [Euryarchaeota archaeon]
MKMRRKAFAVILLIFFASFPVKAQDDLLTGSLEPILVIGGEQGSAQGQFDEPDSVYIDSTGNIYAGDTVNLRVQVFDKDGNFLREMTGFTPIETAVNNEVQGIGELPNGTIVVVEKAGNLYFFDHDGTSPNTVVSMPAISGDEKERDTQGLAVNPDTGDIYITDQPNNKVLIFNSNGVYQGEIALPQFSTPENMVVDADRDLLYVSLEGQRQIAVYGLSNQTQITVFGKEYATMNYEGLALDSDGNILAVDEGPDSASSSQYSRVIIFDRDTYKPIASFGGFAGTEQGRFISPDGIAFDATNKRVAVADQGNYRIQVFDYDGDVQLTPQDDLTVPINKLESSGFGWIVGGYLFGGTFELSQNGTKVLSGEWQFGQKISPDFSSLEVGTYEFSITVTDAKGNSATDTAVLTVTEATEESTKDNGSLPLLGMMAVLAAIPIIRRKRS